MPDFNPALISPASFCYDKIVAARGCTPGRT